MLCRGRRSWKGGCFLEAAREGGLDVNNNTSKLLVFFLVDKRRWRISTLGGFSFLLPSYTYYTSLNFFIINAYRFYT